MAIYTQDISLYSRDAMARLIRSQQTQLDMVQGKISAIISESELADLESGSTTMYNALANVQLDVSGVKADFSRLSSEYDSLTGELVNMDSRIAEYKAGVDGLSAVISQTRAEVRGIGATNLLPMTRAFTSIAAGGAELTDETYTDCVVRRLQASGPGWTSACEYTLSDRVLAGISTEKAAFTVSFWAMGSGTVDVQVIDDTGPGRFTVRDYQPSAILSGDWQRYSATVYCDALPDETSNVSLRIGTTGTADLRICAPKLERGAIATDWAPAPEDGETAIEDVETRTVTLEADVNGIKTDVTKINAGVTEGTFMEQTATSLKAFATSAALVNDNLFFDTGAVYDQILRSNGDLGNVSGYNYVTSDFIHAKAETQYTFQVWTQAVVSRIYAKIVFYDSTKTAIGALPAAQSNVYYYYNTDHATRTFTSPANTAYIRITHGNTGSERGWAKLEEGETATRYSTSPVEGGKVNSQYASINVSIDGINTEVSKKVDGSEIISRINQSAEELKIEAAKLNINGVISANGNVMITEAGKLYAKDGRFVGDVSGCTVQGSSFSTVMLGEEETDDMPPMDIDVYDGPCVYIHENIIECEGRAVFWDAEEHSSNINDSYIYGPMLGVGEKLLNGEVMVNEYAQSLSLAAKYWLSLRINNKEWASLVASSVAPASDSNTYCNEDGNQITRGLNIYTQTVVRSSLRVTGTKPRLVEGTKYGDRLLYCYETPTPMFGDVGFGHTDETGACYVMLDDIYLETVESGTEYAVFLQKEGSGDLWVDQKEDSYFVVKGTANLAFSWELKTVQKGFRDLRLDEPAIVDQQDVDDLTTDLDEDLQKYDAEMEDIFR